MEDTYVGEIGEITPPQIVVGVEKSYAR